MPSVQDIFQDAVNESLLLGEIGIQMAVYKDGELVADVWGGLADTTTGRKVDGDTLFNSFSCVKGITNACLHLLVGRHLASYDDPVARYWPEFGVHGKDRCTLRDILSHRGGVPQMPEGVTPDLMADMGWMTEQLAGMKPLYEPGTRNGYHCYTQGWLVAELVRRIDPQHRPIREFVRDEISVPLGMTDAWYGVPEELHPRIATMYGVGVSARVPPDSPFRLVMPLSVDAVPHIWEAPVVRSACIPGAGAHFSARSEVRFWAMLAEGGTLHGTRIFTPEQVRSFSVPRPDSDVPDSMIGMVAHVSTAGYWQAGSLGMVGNSPHMLGHTAAGSSVVWADPDNRVAVAVCHNHFTEAYMVPLQKAMKRAFGIENQTVSHTDMAVPPRISGIDHVAMTVSDLERSCSFYADLFGATNGARYEVEGNLLVQQMHVGSALLSIHQEGNGIDLAASAPTPGSTDICLRWEGDIQQVIALLSQQGIAMIEGPVDRRFADGARSQSVYVRDPDGNLIELMAAR